MSRRARWQRLSGSLVMSAFMSTSLSGVFSLLEFGLSRDWLLVWAQSILIALPIAFTLDLLFGDRLRQFSNWIADRAAKAGP